jgi:UDP-glucose 4-epimerase
VRILITGSSGQIGTNVGLKLLERGDEVFGLDNRPNGWTNRVPAATCELHCATAEDLPISGKFDCVLHLAAHAKVFELVENPIRAMENVQMAFTVCEYCRLTRTPLIFASSREVYGDIQRHITDEAQADFVVAESPYSASKISAEAFIYSYGKCYELPYTVLRFSNVYGRYDTDAQRMERVIPLFIDRIARDVPITVFGREKVLDFTYVDDCSAGILAAIERLVGRQINNETINLAYGQGSTLVDLVNLISLSLRKEPRVTYEPARKGEVTRYVADISKARRLLGYNPQTPLTGGIPRAVKWQQEMGILPRM